MERFLRSVAFWAGVLVGVGAVVAGVELEEGVLRMDFWWAMVGLCEWNLGVLSRVISGALIS